MTDFYEFLQISPNADSDTIHRVYRFLAARLHPDNQKSGNVGMFNQLKAAYDVLSNPARRSEYDTARRQEPRLPLSSTIDFMDDLEGELNRRLAVLAVLYYRRRTSPNLPEVSLAQLEERMGFPRDYLDFTLWYLARKGYIAKTDSAQFTLSADGVDFVETERARIPTLHRLLTSGSETTVDSVTQGHSDEDVPLDSMRAIAGRRLASEDMTDHRENRKERRVGAPDRRVIKVERRGHLNDRRSDATTRRKIN